MSDPAPETPVKTNPFQRIAGVLFAPAQTFEDIARKPDVLVPLIVLLVVSFLTTFVLIPKMDFEAAVRTQMESSGQQMSPGDMDRAVRIGAGFGKAMAYTGPLWGALAWVVIAAVLLLAFRLFGGEGTFKQAFSVTLYSFMPGIISSIVMAIVGATRDSFDPTMIPTMVKSNPAFLVDMKEQPVLFSFLGSLDVFTIWSVVLLVFGFAAISRLSRVKSAVIIVSLWFAVILVKLGFAAMGAARMKG